MRAAASLGNPPPLTGYQHVTFLTILSQGLALFCRRIPLFCKRLLFCRRTCIYFTRMTKVTSLDIRQISRPVYTLTHLCGGRLVF